MDHPSSPIIAALLQYYSSTASSSADREWLAARVDGPWRAEFMGRESASSSASSSSSSSQQLVGAGLCTLPAVSFLSPRAKMDVEVIESGAARGLALTDVSKGVTYAVPIAAIAYAFHLRRPARNSKDPRFAAHMWLLKLRSAEDSAGELHFRGSKKPLRWVCFQFELKGKAAKAGWGAEEKLALRRPWAGASPAGSAVLSGALPTSVDTLMTDVLSASGATLVRPDKAVFCSSAGTASIKCYHGVKDGQLYPLANGVLFTKSPFIFVPAESINEFVFGRGGSAVGRTVDVVITTDSGEQYEFGMIEKVETEPLRQYAAHLAKLRQRAERRAVAAASSSAATTSSSSSSSSSSSTTAAAATAETAAAAVEEEGAAARVDAEESENSEDAESDYNPEGSAEEGSGSGSDDDGDESSGSDDDGDEDEEEDDDDDAESERKEREKGMEVEMKGEVETGEAVAAVKDEGIAPPHDDNGEETASDDDCMPSAAAARAGLKRDSSSVASASASSAPPAAAAAPAAVTKVEAAVGGPPAAKKRRLVTDMFKAIPASK